ncbi:MULTISPECIES: hypothetical protein [unclassified Microcoleus]|nr:MULTISPECIES: hypothetical protein [unclassified Microcoleus]
MAKIGIKKQKINKSLRKTLLRKVPKFVEVIQQAIEQLINPIKS